MVGYTGCFWFRDHTLITLNTALIHIAWRPHTPLQLMTLKTLTRVWVARKSVERRRQSLAKPRETSWPTLFVTSRQMSATALIILSHQPVLIEWCVHPTLPSKDLLLLRRTPRFKVWYPTVHGSEHTRESTNCSPIIAPGCVDPPEPACNCTRLVTFSLLTSL